MAAFEEAAHTRVIGVVMAAHHGNAFGGRRAGADGTRAGGIALPGTKANTAPEDFARSGQRHSAQNRAPGFHQPDIDREIIPPGGKFPRAIQGVHQPETLSMAGRRAGGDFFFGNHGNVGSRGAQPFHNQRFGDPVSLGHRGMVGFPFHRETGGLDCHDGASRPGHEIAGQGQQRIIFHASALALAALGRKPCFGRDASC